MVIIQWWSYHSIAQYNQKTKLSTLHVLPIFGKTLDGNAMVTEVLEIRDTCCWADCLKWTLNFKIVLFKQQLHLDVLGNVILPQNLPSDQNELLQLVSKSRSVGTDPCCWNYVATNMLFLLFCLFWMNILCYVYFPGSQRWASTFYLQPF